MGTAHWADQIRIRTAAVMSSLMLVAGIAAWALEPRQLASDDVSRKIDLEVMVPTRFGEWAVDASIIPILPPPELKAVLERTYSQTLARTYVDRAGNRVMLSIAYGGTHGEGMQTHRPEICYPAQGFRITEASRPSAFSTPFGTVKATRLVATLGRRVEPILYWTVVGERQSSYGLQMKLDQLRYGLTGVLPDGMLIRVSSISAPTADLQSVQEAFASELLAASHETLRARLIGAVGGG